MDEILKFIERVNWEEKHSKKCRGITTYTDGVDYWDELDASKCTCDRYSRINQRIAEAWYASLARPLKDLIGRCTCGHPKSRHAQEAWCKIDGCQCTQFKGIR